MKQLHITRPTILFRIYWSNKNVLNRIVTIRFYESASLLSILRHSLDIIIGQIQQNHSASELYMNEHCNQHAYCPVNLFEYFLRFSLQEMILNRKSCSELQRNKCASYTEKSPPIIWLKKWRKSTRLNIELNDLSRKGKCCHCVNWLLIISL